jgi:hypothetical protein
VRRTRREKRRKRLRSIASRLSRRTWAVIGIVAGTVLTTLVSITVSDVKERVTRPDPLAITVEISRTPVPVGSLSHPGNYVVPLPQLGSRRLR